MDNSELEANKGGKAHLKEQLIGWFNRERFRSVFTPKGLIKGLKITGLAMLSLVLLGVGFYYSVRWGAFGPIPEVAELANIRNHTASEVFAADEQTLLGKYYLENRSNVQYEDISAELIQALVATEDARFYEHAGVDTRSMMRVAFKSVLLGDKSAGGGSTLSQQLAKNLYPREDYSILSLPVNKIKEILIAQRLEEVYSKEEILTLYLNTVSFGENVYGISAATQRFFSTTPKEVSLNQAAVLVGMLKATTAYNPRLFPERARDRRNVVLDQMVKYGYLPPATADSLKSDTLRLKYRNVTSQDGLAPYFRQELANTLKHYFETHPGPDGKIYNLYTDGLKIYTTLDHDLQAYAEKAVKTHMQALQKTFDNHWEKRKLWAEDDPQISRAMRQSPRYRALQAQGLSEEAILTNFQTPIPMRLWSWEGEIEREISPLDSIRYYHSFLQAGLMVMEPQSGFVRAWVGGINHRHFKYDHVTARRQVGSTFKPFIYASALKAGVDPCDYISSEKVVYSDYENWTPGNADGKYDGYYSLQGGLTHSVNTVSAAVMMKVGMQQAMPLVKDFGFTSPLPDGPSLVLGTAELSLQEMVGAYSTFANRGVRAKPVFITHITDAQGQVLAEFPQGQEKHNVLDQETANMMAHMLCSVVDSGTASRLRRVYGLRNQIGGKTGTTQDQTDGWFIGITPHLVVGAWVGGETRRVRFRSLSLGQGANTALPIAGKFLQQYYRDNRFKRTRSSRFEDLSDDSAKSLDCPMYTLDPNQDQGLKNLLLILKQRRMERQARRFERQQQRAEKKRRNKWKDLFKKKNRN